MALLFKKAQEPDINLSRNVAMQSVAIGIISLFLALLCPFAEAEETGSLNALHDLLSNSISFEEVPISFPFRQSKCLGIL